MTSPIRYSRLGYVALQVSDVAASRDFYTRLVGLVPGPEGNARTAYLRCSDKPFDIVLEQGDPVGLLRVGYETESVDNLRIAFDHVAKCGYSPVWQDAVACEVLKAKAAFRFANPTTGMAVELFAGQSVGEPYEPTVAQIARLGHVVMNVKSYADAHRFWVDDLGFTISDHVPGKIAFLRCFPNPLHHSLALLEGPADGYNHVNFMVTDIDDIGRAMNRMKKADVPIVFGPGRHLPSTSIFIYFLDPDGMTAEYSFGMEEIHAEDARDPRVLEPKPEVLDTWGSLPDPRFGKGGVIVHG